MPSASVAPTSASPTRPGRRARQITQCVRGLDFPRQQLPPNFHYVGPLRGAEPAMDFDLPDDGRPLIFCSLGTLQGSRAALFRAVAKAVAGLDANLLIAHGGMLADRDVARLPGRPAGPRLRPAARGACPKRARHHPLRLQHRARFAQPRRADGRLAAHLRAAGDRRTPRARRARPWPFTAWRTSRRIRSAIEQVLGDPAHAANARGLAAEIAASGGADARPTLSSRRSAVGVRPAAATTARAAPDDARGDSRSGSS